jgi:hypothetical protein
MTQFAPHVPEKWVELPPATPSILSNIVCEVGQALRQDWDQFRPEQPWPKVKGKSARKTYRVRY